MVSADLDLFLLLQELPLHPSSIVSNPSFLGAIGSDAGAISDSVINKMLNISAIEIDLESEDMGNEG